MPQTITSEGLVNAVDKDMRVFFEIKKQFGIHLEEYNSFRDYMAALFERVSSDTLSTTLQITGDAYDGLIEKELKKREVHV